MPIEVTDATFEQEVLKSEGPILVDFWAPWCGPCRTIGPILEEIEQELDGALVVAKINIDECPMAAQSMRIQSIPAMWLFRGGQPLGQLVGAQPKEQLMQFIGQHLGALGVEALSPKDVEQAVADQGAVLVDIRQPVEYDRGHLPGAISAPVDHDDVDTAELPEALTDLKDQRIVVYCRSGKAATPLARRLLKEGFASVATVDEGVFGWEVSDRRLVSD